MHATLKVEVQGVVQKIIEEEDCLSRVQKTLEHNQHTKSIVYDEVTTLSQQFVTLREKNLKMSGGDGKVEPVECVEDLQFQLCQMKEELETLRKLNEEHDMELRDRVHLCQDDNSIVSMSSDDCNNHDLLTALEHKKSNLANELIRERCAADEMKKIYVKSNHQQKETKYNLENRSTFNVDARSEVLALRKKIACAKEKVMQLREETKTLAMKRKTMVNNINGLDTNYYQYERRIEEIEDELKALSSHKVVLGGGSEACASCCRPVNVSVDEECTV